MAVIAGSSQQDFDRIDREMIAEGREAYQAGIPYYPGAFPAWRMGWIAAMKEASGKTQN